MEEAQGRLLGQYAYRLGLCWQLSFVPLLGGSIQTPVILLCVDARWSCAHGAVTGSGSRWARHAISHRQLGAWDYTEVEMHVRAAVATLAPAAARPATVRSRADLGAGGHARPALYPPPEAPRVLLGAAILRR
eukprot:scaffold1424_cov359-Prasinococcus_capsulatus_cf.AAC.3